MFGFFKSSDKHIEKKILGAKALMERAIVNDDDALAKTCLTARFKGKKDRSYALNPSAEAGGMPSFLHICAQLNRPRIADSLIAGGADVHKRAEDGITPLHTAARYGATAVAQSLLKAGADIDAQTADGLTALHRAVLHNQTTMAEFLLKNGARADIRSGSGKTAEQIALENNFMHFLPILDKTERQALPAPATPSQDTVWEKVDARTVAKTRRVESGGLTLTEIFDFAARERKTLTRFDAGAALGETKSFDQIHEKNPLEEALAKLKELGGTPDPESILHPPRRMGKLPGRNPPAL